MNISKYKDKVDKVNAILLDSKMLTGLIGLGACAAALGIPITILPVTANILTHGGIVVLGGVVAYISGDLIKDAVKSNNKEVK
jgi:hypothetical protein|nr:MAG TPA: hypothetical protein [Caudoviricetes sp.]